MNKNILLSLMLACYLLPIIIVSYKYDSNKSISNIICDNKYKYYILFFMILMGVWTLLYELERNDKYSQILICILLIGIYGLIYVNERHITHYYFAYLVFISILFFMLRQCYLTNYNAVLMSSLSLEILTLFYIFVFNYNIFLPEVIYILNFAFYYLYLHLITPLKL